MHINSMPDRVLLLIFSKVPLNNLIYLGRVCALWRSYQLDITRKVDSLTLLSGGHFARHLITKSCFTLKYRNLLLKDDGTRMYSSQYLSNYFHINCFEFPLNFSKEMFKLFPSITALEIAIEKSYLYTALSLLVKWAPNLTSLKMYVELSHGENLFDRLLEVINSMPSLEHLTLDIFGSSNLHNYDYHFLNLPILGKLREFYFNCESKNIERSLNNYAVANDNLEQIGITIYPHGLQSFYHRSPSLSGKIAHLNLLSPQVDTMRNILKSFTSLSNFYLQLQTSETLLTGALNFLQPLKQLTHLHLQMSNFNKLRSLNQVSLDQITQLASVQVLTITTTLQSTSSFESNHWAHVFPSVQVIELNLKFSLIQNPRLFFMQEIQQSLSPFVQCPKLHHLFTNLQGFGPGQDYTEWIVQQVNQRKIITEVSK